MDQKQSQALFDNLVHLYKANKFLQAQEKASIFQKLIPAQSQLYEKVLKINADALEALCQYHRAIEMYELIKKNLKQKKNKITSQWISAQLGIVKCLSMLKDSDERLTILRQLQWNILEVQGQQSQNFAKVKLELGSTYMQSGEYTQSLKQLQCAIKLLQKKMNEDYINCRASIGFLYSRQGKYRQALEYLSQTQKLAQKTIGRKNYAYILTKRNFASATSFLGNFKIANQALMVAKQLSIQCFGKKHPLYASIMNVEGANYHRQKSANERKKALVCYEEAKDIIKSIFGQQHMQYVYLMYNLAGVYSCNQKTYQAAEKNFKNSLRLWENIKGKQNPRYVDFLIGTAKFYYKSNQLDIADQFIAEAEQIYADNNFNIPTTYLNMNSAKGLIMKKRGKFEQAEKYYKIVVDLRLQIFGPDHPEYLSAIKQLQSIRVQKLKQKGQQKKEQQNSLLNKYTPQQYESKLKKMEQQNAKLIARIIEKDKEINSLKKSQIKQKEKRQVVRIGLKLIETVLDEGVIKQWDEIVVFGMVIYGKELKKQVNSFEIEKLNNRIFWNWKMEIRNEKYSGWVVENDKIIMWADSIPSQSAIQIQLLKVQLGQISMLGTASINISNAQIATKNGIVQLTNGDKTIGKVQFSLFFI